MAKKSSKETIVSMAILKFLNDKGITPCGQNTFVNEDVERLLRTEPSKSGGNGGNYPDFNFFVGEKNKHLFIIEVKGFVKRMVKTKDGFVSKDTKDVKDYAVNGAIHYGRAVSKDALYSTVFVAGIAPANDEVGDTKFDCEIYKVENEHYEKVNLELDQIDRFDEWFDKYNKEEKPMATKDDVRRIYEELFNTLGDDKKILNQKERVNFIVGLFIALKTGTLKIDSFESKEDEVENDGKVIIDKITSFYNGLKKQNRISEQTFKDFTQVFSSLFSKEFLWKPNEKETCSLIKKCVNIILKHNYTKFDVVDIIYDYSWSKINENDNDNDIVPTPREVGELMAKLCEVKAESKIFDPTMGHGALLNAAYKQKIEQINLIENELERDEMLSAAKDDLYGIETEYNMFLLAMNNFILCDACPEESHMLRGSSLTFKNNNGKDKNLSDSFKDTIDVMLVNPPYSADGNGLIFVRDNLHVVKEHGKICLLIQESAGSGQGKEYAKEILKHCQLKASIKMPTDIFWQSSVATTLLVFEKTKEKHDIKKLVTFIDFSNDGYSRSNRKNNVKVISKDNAEKRYQEIVDIVTNSEKKSNFYPYDKLTITDTISLEGNDWLFTQHQKIDTTPTEKDFKKTVADLFSWQMSNLMKGTV